MNITVVLNPLFESLKPSPTLYINEQVNRLWKKGYNIYHMGFGESRFSVHPKLQQALEKNSLEKSYLPSQGLPELRQKISDFHNKHLNINSNAENVIIAPGSKSLIYALQLALDAELLLPIPSWVSYAPQAHILNRPVRYIASNIKTSYQLDLDELDRVVNSSTHPSKLLIINSPNNPSGTVFTPETLQALADYCRKNNILVLSDEIYFLVNHGETPHHSIAEYYPEGTILLSGLSKHLSLGGWRLGSAILPNNDLGRELMRILTIIASETWSSASTPIQYAALIAYGDDQEINKYVEECSQLHGIRTRHLYNELSILNIQCTKPEGAFYLVANFDQWKKQLARQSINSSEDLAKYLLNHYKIATLPGNAFGIPENELSLRLATSYLDLENNQNSERLLHLLRTGLTDDQLMSKEHHPNFHGAITAFKSFIDNVNST